MMMTMRKRATVMLAALCVAALGLAMAFAGGGLSASAANSAKPDTSGMKSLITSASQGRVIWSITGDPATCTYTYDESAGASVKINEEKMAASLNITHSSTAATGEVVHSFTTVLSESSFNSFVFRANGDYSNFISFQFRRLHGHVGVVSRNNNIFYGNPGILPDGATEAYSLVMSPTLAGMTAGDSVTIVIKSTAKHMSAWIGDECIYQIDLLHEMNPSSGMFHFSQMSTWGLQPLTNVKCFAAETAWNNAVKSDGQRVEAWNPGGIENIAYTPATAEAGASLTSSNPQLSGGRVLIGQYPSSDTVIHRFTSNLSPISSYAWNMFVFRADADGSFMAYMFRNDMGHRTLISYDAKTDSWASYSTDIFAGISENASALYEIVSNPGNVHVDKSSLEVTIRSSKTSVDVWYGTELVYSETYALELPAATGIMIFGRLSTYGESSFTNISCYDENADIAAISVADKTYDGTPVTAPELRATRLGSAYDSANLKTEYKLTSAADTAYTTTAPSAAGEYTVRVSVDSAIDSIVKAKPAYDTFTVSKANYTGKTHAALSGTYDLNKTLADYALESGYSWMTAATVPTVNVTSYAAKYNADPANYNDFELEITLNLAKADYTGISHDALSGTYDPSKTLADFTLESGYSWVTAATLPTVNVTSYAAKYNGDPVNYNDFSMNITLNLAKANYTGKTHDALSGTYDPNKTLADYASQLGSGWSWKNASTVPTVSAGAYAAKFNADTVNYNDFELNITLNLAKANYTGKTHDALSGTYDPNKTLADYALESGYSWVTSSAVPTVNVTSYAAKYNADPANYNDFTLNITLNLTKADAGTIASPSASDVVRGNKLSSSTLSGGDVNGTFAFKNPDLVMNEAGEFDVVVVFTPTDTVNYNPAEKTIKVKVTPNDQDKADVVKGLISALPETVALTDKSAVEAARAAYQALTDAQKALVTNLSVLESAEAKLEELAKPTGCGGEKSAASAAAGVLLIAAGAVLLKRKF